MLLIAVCAVLALARAAVVDIAPAVTVPNGLVLHPTPTAPLGLSWVRWLVVLIFWLAAITCACACASDDDATGIVGIR